MNFLKNAPFGYAHHEIILSREGKPVDCRFLETNPAFDNLIGMDSQEIIGKTFSELRPDIRKVVLQWITVCEKLALEGFHNNFQHYSETLKRWYSVQVYSPGKGYFTAVFWEITPNKIIEEAASKFNNFTPANIDYQYMTDQARILSGARYAVFNQFDEKGKSFTTMGFSGINRNVEKAVGMLGFDFRGKKWPHDPHRENLIKGRQTTLFLNLKELTGTSIPGRVVDWLCKTFHIKSAAVIKAEKDGIPIGDFTLLFAPDADLRHRETLELYANLTGMLITRIETEKKFRQDHERLALAMDAGEQGFWDWNLETGDVYFSPRYFSMLGYNDRELPLQIETWSNLLHPEDKKWMESHLKQYLDGKIKNYSIEFRMMHKDGTVRWILANGKALRNNKGRPIRMAGSHSDITLRKKTELTLRDSEEKVSKIGNAALDAVIMINDEGKVEYWNKAATKMFGFPGTYMIGKDVHQHLMPEKYKKAYETAWQNFRETGRGPAIGQLIELEAKTAGGDAIPIEIALSPITIKNRMWALAYVRDISARKQAEKDLIEARNAAENANRAKSEFLANMSHEIRTPMNSILGFSEVMLNTTRDPQQINYLRTILDSGKTLLSLINDILDLSKIEAGRLEVSPEPTNIRTLVNEMKQLFHHKLREKHLDFIIEIDDNLPDAILIDEVRLQQILLNLIGNAIKFTPEGFVKTEITVLRFKEEYIDFELAVSDSGIGIPEKDHQNIFDSFSQQSGQDTRQFGGTGLGLAISKRLTKLMNGNIGVDSTPGKGSRFSLTFSEIKFCNERAEKEDFYIWDAHELVFDPSKLLIVDDVPHNRKLVTIFLGQYDFSMLEAENGEMAIQMAEAHLPDLILMDIRMPGINGYEATEKIKQIEKTAHIPVIALTASTMQSEIKKITQLFDGYLRKPTQKKALVNELARHLPFKEKAEAPASLDKIPEEKNRANTPMAPGVIETFKRSFEETIKEQTSLMDIDQLYETTGQLEDFACKHQIPPLTEKTKKLRNHLEAFEIEGIKNELKEIIRLFY